MNQFDELEKRYLNAVVDSKTLIEMAKIAHVEEAGTDCEDDTLVYWGAFEWHESGYKLTDRVFGFYTAKENVTENNPKCLRRIDKTINFIQRLVCNLRVKKML